jgi:hypothetical protein
MKTKGKIPPTNKGESSPSIVKGRAIKKSEAIDVTFAFAMADQDFVKPFIDAVKSDERRAIKSTTRKQLSSNLEIHELLRSIYQESEAAVVFHSTSYSSAELSQYINSIVSLRAKKSSSYKVFNVLLDDTPVAAELRDYLTFNTQKESSAKIVDKVVSQLVRLKPIVHSPTLTKSANVYRVYPYERNWIIQKSGASKPLKHFPSKKFALSYMNKLMRDKPESKATVHDTSGGVVDVL